MSQIIISHSNDTFLDHQEEDNLSIVDDMAGSNVSFIQRGSTVDTVADGGPLVAQGGGIHYYYVFAYHYRPTNMSVSRR